MEVDEGVLLSELITDQNSTSDDIPDNSSISILDNLLKCSICYDYFDTCVITDCSHNFCSLCIRRYIQYKTECPVCFKELYDSSLRANRVVDEFRKLFPEIKDRIVKCVRTINSRKPHSVSPSPQKNAEFKTPKKVHSTSNIAASVPEVATVSHKPSLVAPSVTRPSVTQTQSASDRVLIPKMFFSPSKRSCSNPEKNCVMQECPVCNVFIPERNMNRHLDDCLKRSEEASKAKNSPPVNKRTPLPKLVFRLLSSTNLRNKAKEYGLSHHGDNETLKNRIQKYTALYNAECDKPNPRPVSELIRQLEREEKVLALQKLPKNNILSHMGDVTDKSKVRAQYLKENEKSFENLINKVKNQQANKKKETAPLADLCQPSTSKTHFDLSYGALDDDMLEIDEIKIEQVDNDSQQNPELVQPEKHSSEEEDAFNPTKRKSFRNKRLDFEECSPESVLFDAERIKLEPDVEIFEVSPDRNVGSFEHLFSFASSFRGEVGRRRGRPRKYPPGEDPKSLRTGRSIDRPPKYASGAVQCLPKFQLPRISCIKRVEVKRGPGRPRKHPPNERRPRKHPPNERRPHKHPPNERWPLKYPPDGRRPLKYPPDERRPLKYSPDERRPLKYSPDERRPLKYPPNERRPLKYPPDKKRPGRPRKCPPVEVPKLCRPGQSISQPPKCITEGVQCLAKIQLPQVEVKKGPGRPRKYPPNERRPFKYSLDEWRPEQPRMCPPVKAPKLHHTDQSIDQPPKYAKEIVLWLPKIQLTRLPCASIKQVEVKRGPGRPRKYPPGESPYQHSTGRRVGCPCEVAPEESVSVLTTDRQVDREVTCASDKLL